MPASAAAEQDRSFVPSSSLDSAKSFGSLSSHKRNDSSSTKPSDLSSPDSSPESQKRSRSVRGASPTPGAIATQNDSFNPPYSPSNDSPTHGVQSSSASHRGSNSEQDVSDNTAIVSTWQPTSAEGLKKVFEQLRAGQICEPVTLIVDFSTYQTFWTIIDAGLYDFVTLEARFDYHSDSRKLSIHMTSEPHSDIVIYIERLIRGYLEKAIDTPELSDIVSAIVEIRDTSTGKLAVGPRPEERDHTSPGQAPSSTPEAVPIRERDRPSHLRPAPTLKPPDRYQNVFSVKKTETFSPDASWTWREPGFSAANTRPVVVEVAKTQSLHDLAEKAHHYILSPMTVVNVVIGVVMKSNGQPSELLEGFSPEKGAAYLIVWRQSSRKKSDGTFVRDVKVATCTQLLAPSGPQIPEDVADTDTALVWLPAFVPPQLLANLPAAQLHRLYAHKPAVVPVNELAEQIRVALRPKSEEPRVNLEEGELLEVLEAYFQEYYEQPFKKLKTSSGDT